MTSLFSWSIGNAAIIIKNNKTNLICNSREYISQILIAITQAILEMFQKFCWDYINCEFDQQWECAVTVEFSYYRVYQ